MLSELFLCCNVEKNVFVDVTCNDVYNLVFCFCVCNLPPKQKVPQFILFQQFRKTESNKIITKTKININVHK